MRFLLVGLVTPHAPVLLPEVRAGSNPSHTSSQHERPDCVVLLSPHGTSSGVYGRVEGDLDGFGKLGIEAARPTDPDLVARLAERWGRPVLDEPCDHGVVVPLLAGSIPDVPVVACTLQEITGPHASPVDGAIEDARRFADALTSLVGERNVLFVASAHTSAALSPQAPLTLRDEGLALDEEIKNALDQDVRLLDSIDPQLWSTGGACGAGPLVALGLLFSGSKADVAWYDHPFGVGYLLALVLSRGVRSRKRSLRAPRTPLA